MALSVSAQSSGGIVLTWPASEHAFFLEQSASIPGPWSPNQRPIVEKGGQNHVTPAVNVDQNRFFRLREGYAEAVPLDALLLDPIGYDRGPSLSRDGLSLYYFADVGGTIDLWFTTRPSVTSPWEWPLPLDAINTSYFETFPALSPNGLALFFSEWHPGDPRTDPRPEGFGGGDIWVSTRTNLRGAWGPPMNLGRVVNTEWREASPSFSTDGLTLIFTSDRPGGVFGSGRDGNNDLWMSTRSDASDPFGWGPPVHLGRPVNSAFADEAPSLSSDGLMLYFMSRRPDDSYRKIWVSTRSSLSQPFGTPVSLARLLPQFINLVDPCLSADGSSLLFAASGLWEDPDSDKSGYHWHLWQLRVLRPPPLSISLTTPSQR